MTTGVLIWYLFSSVILAAVLFKPTSKFLYALKAKSVQRKLNRDFTEEERKEIEKKIIPTTALIVVTFAFIFNKILIYKYFLSK